MWTIENGAQEMTSSFIPMAERKFEDVVDLLKSNVVVEHYDLIKRHDLREGK